MDNVSEIVALLRKQVDLEIAIMNGHSSSRPLVPYDARRTQSPCGT